LLRELKEEDLIVTPRKIITDSQIKFDKDKKMRL